MGSIGANQAQLKDNLKASAAMAQEESAVYSAIRRTSKQLDDCAYHLEQLIGRIDPALRPESQEVEQLIRGPSESLLATDIEDLAERAHIIRMRIIETVERLTL